MPRIRLTPARAAVAALVAVGAIFSATLGTASASGLAHAAPTCTVNNPCIHTGSQGDVDKGSTAGWLNGHTVTFKYSKNFYCAAPPSSGAPTFCEAGADAQFAPVTGQIDPLYVITPVGFTPATSTLQCPIAGNCVDHPHNIDLSRVFGSSAANIALPPHSHVVTTAAKGVAEWWRIIVVGVTNQTAWDSIVSGKSIKAVTACQTSMACTADISSNLFLYFAVK
ncbi:MAG: hypothetical protein M3R48_06860 [Candidatus Dormibacteraeota bacterium]|nr:hypothetical protein [Candidatus Dormibacteraeota bacterium]